ncbi:uncharacterized protein LOC126886143 [Diabrotica virgifera virgifera]|uniref:ribonuclease H n=1 Tax=Diabrotica virgifera virgifera TaxID=50390 RepID=A0ABM5KFL3_DIAVI|nr:uncharacterized protein LOC126886143 [Diabrotica virgifera virgifera]
MTIQINDMITKANKGINVMRAICGTKWGADPNILLSLYKGIVRSHLDYAANLLNPCSKSLMMRLEQVQNVALRIHIQIYSKKTKNIIRYKINPIYEVERKTLLYPITIKSLEFEKYEIESNERFIAKYGGMYNNHTHVYTEGSIDPQTNQSGFGIYIPSINYKYSSRLHNYTQICTTEIIAVYKAISVCIEKEIMKAVIFLDSKSALSKISSHKWDQMDYVTIMTKKLLVDANNMGFSIGLEWVPGHQGIKGNEVADSLANIGR